MAQDVSHPLPVTNQSQAAPSSTARLVVAAPWVNRVLWSMLAILLIGNVFSQITDHRDYLGRAAVQGLFDVTLESSLPTWLSAALFLGSAGLFLAIRTTIHEPNRLRAKSWYLVAALMVALSIDEVASLHETVSPTVREALGVGGFLHYAWLVPALLMVVVIGAVLIPWFLSLPKRLRSVILVAGGLFLTGTVALELIGGYLADTGMRMSAEWTAVASIEESLELIGVAVLFSGLLAYVASRIERLRVDFE